MKDKLLLVNGPNLNLLGLREPEKYGSKNLIDISNSCNKMAESEGFPLKSFQSNSEGEIIDFIQQPMIQRIPRIHQRPLEHAEIDNHA